MRVSSDGASVEIPGDVKLTLENGSIQEYAGRDVALGIRPEHFELTEEKTGVMQLSVDHVEQLGADTLVHGHLGEDGALLTVRLPDIHYFKKHTSLPLAVPPEKLHLFDKESGKRIEG